MKDQYEEFLSKYKKNLEHELVQSIDRLNAPLVLKESMDYSLSAGGKRIRPLLLFATMHAFGRNPELGLATACALEMVHTYSLIHDDLPSMDDDDLRRGKPTNHKVFGEAVAILAGDGLLTYSFEMITRDKNLGDSDKIWLIRQLAQNAGPEGMVAGQVADIQAEKKELNLNELEYVHQHKTGKLLAFSVMAGAKIGGGSEEEILCFQKFSYHLGLAFQIRDDILDVIGDESIIGKPVGSDDGKFKSTYPAILSLQGAKDQLAYHTEQAKNTLHKINKDTGLLLYLTDQIAGRSN